MNRKRYYWKTQTAWVRRPALIEAHRNTDVVGVGIYPSQDAADRSKREAARIYLTPHEAIGFAAWLNEQAEAVLAMQAKAEARRAARAAAKEAKKP